MDLFDEIAEQHHREKGPLASRMRPETLDEFIGQEHIIGHGRLLRRSIEADQLSAMVFYGPPGTGKTTLARIIARTTSAFFEQLNAVTSGVSDIRNITKAAKDRLKMEEQKTILFIDEIHRFNKSQQDALLPFVEDGTLILVGATTENPMYEINRALLSRSRLFQFEPLTDQEVSRILTETLKDYGRGFGRYPIDLHKEALEHLVHVADGDARSALNALELAVLTTDPDKNGTLTIDIKTAEESIQKRVLQYDKKGDNHYDTVSAFIKSMRGSDPDASLYWLAKMIHAGEDPRFIARRIYVHAAEDVGLADPNALLIAQAAAFAVDFIGMPEAQIPLAEAVLYIATAPKSNTSVMGINEALATVKQEKSGHVPLHLRDTHYQDPKQMKNAKAYLYPHDFKNGYVAQDYLPDPLKNKKFYHPTGRGYEKTVQKRLEFFLKKIQQNHS